MGEVDGPKFGVNQVNYSKIQNTVNEVPTEETEQETKQIQDFSDDRAEALGRSMLFKGNDCTDRDLKALLENPQIAENSDRMFEEAYSAAQSMGLENAYEEAASISTTAM